MNRNAFSTAIVFAVLVVGVLIGRATYHAPDRARDADASSERKILYWVAPMDASYRRDQPGKSPMGMDLVPVYEDESTAQPEVVLIDPAIVNNLGVRTEKAKFGLLPRIISTVGYVGYDEDTVEHVHTRVEGWIEKLVTKTSGDPVTKGQLLFELYSRTLVNAQEEYLTALRSNNHPLLKASLDRLQSFGVGAREIARLEKEKTVRQRVPVYAEVDGVIAHLGVREGIYVTPSMEIMSVAKLDSIWVLAEVFERQAAWVRAGQVASVELDYLPGQTWQGVVDYVYPELNAVTRTLKVRIRFVNEAVTLRPNMFSRVTIRGDDFGDVIHIPREAVLRGGSMDRVVVATGNGRFRVQPVTIGIESGDRVAIRSGLSEGDEIVVSAQFLIDSEANIESALSRMESPQ
jgi:membrane fusion protein, copper/silver efflux system